MNRSDKLNKYLRYWQRVLNLQSWDLKIKLVKFKRTDYLQSGDIKVNAKNKSAVVLIAKEPTKKDRAIILHELIHLLLWEYDQFCEKTMKRRNKYSPAQKNRYFDLLEQTVANLEKIFLQRDV